MGTKGSASARSLAAVFAGDAVAGAAVPAALGVTAAAAAAAAAAVVVVAVVVAVVVIVVVATASAVVAVAIVAVAVTVVEGAGVCCDCGASSVFRFVASCPSLAPTPFAATVVDGAFSSTIASGISLFCCR